MIANQVGKPDVAIECIGGQCSKGTDGAFYCNLGNAIVALGNLDEAISSFRRALKFNPRFAEAHSNLGHVLKEQGQLDEAVACCRRAIKLKPNFAEAHSNLGNALMRQRELDEAAACYRRAIELQPDLAEPHNNLGGLLQERGQTDEAIACYRRALECKPNFALAYSNLGHALHEQRKPEEAIACYRRASSSNRISPMPTMAWAACSRNKASRTKRSPTSAGQWSLQPDLATANDNLLCAFYFCSDCDAQTIYDEHRRWNQRFGEPLAKSVKPHVNERSADRRLASAMFRRTSANMW